MNYSIHSLRTVCESNQTSFCLVVVRLGPILATSMPMSGNIKGSFVGPVLVLLGKLYKFL